MPSFRPSTFVESSGLWTGRGKIGSARFVLFDYNGKRAVAVPALKAVIKPADENDTIDQYWTAGRPEDWQPSSDGKFLNPVGKATALNTGSNLAQFLAELVNAGFPEDLLDAGDASVLDGLDADFDRVQGPERTFKEDGKDVTKRGEILVITKIHAMPGEKPAKGKGKGKASGDDVTVKAETALLKILAENGGEVAKKDLPKMIFDAIPAGDPDRGTIMGIVLDEAFLGGGSWTYADGMLKL